MADGNNTVTLMSDFSGEAVHTSPEEILLEAVIDVDPGEIWEDYKKMLIIACSLDECGPTIDVANAGLTPADMLVVSKLLELEALSLMGYGPAEEED